MSLAWSGRSERLSSLLTPAAAERNESFETRNLKNSGRADGIIVVSKTSAP